MSEEQPFEAWYKARDERQLRVKYPLNDNSVVLDVGAYKGDWAKKIHELYNCRVICIEPVRGIFEELKQNTDGIAKIEAVNLAVSDTDGVEKICVQNDASSFYLSGSSETVQAKRLSSVLEGLGLKSVDFLKLNIEGAEYVVLEDLIRSNTVDLFTHIQIQFHMNVLNYRLRRDSIQKELARTHNKDYDYSFIWESWTKKESV